MKIQTLEKRIQGVIALTLLIVFVALLWIWKAPYVECYVNEGTCVYYVERNSDFFVADFFYATLMFAAAVLVSILYRRHWWEAGIGFQIGLATYGLMLSILVALIGQFIRPLTMINELKADAGLELRSLGALFILPSVVQVILTVTGTLQTRESRQHERET